MKSEILSENLSETLTETLFEAIGNINDDFVQEAADQNVRNDRFIQKITKFPGGRSILAACALLAVILTAAAGLPDLLHSGPNIKQTDPASAGGALPKLTVADFSGGFGFEGLMAYRPEELVDTNPWNESAVPQTMPVFKNQNPTDPAGATLGDRERLTAQVQEIADRLGLTELTFSDEPSYIEGVPGISAVVGKGPGVKITAYGSQQIQIRFEPALKLPDALNFTYHDSTYADMEAVGEYLKDIYADLLRMENPVLNVTAGDYTFSGEQNYELYFYEGAGDVTEQLISHDLKNMRFCCNDDGDFWIVWIQQYDLSEKTGDYPVITPEEAKALLCGGNYITTVPAEMPGKEYIVKTQLVYRTDRTAEYFMPYYRFLVEVSNEALGFKPDALAEGLKTFGAYYVPAVRAEYLAEMPVWNGSFN